MKTLSLKKQFDLYLLRREERKRHAEYDKTPDGKKHKELDRVKVFTVKSVHIAKHESEHFLELDILTLSDGSVIGINSENIVLYENVQQLWDSTSENKPTIERKHLT